MAPEIKVELPITYKRKHFQKKVVYDIRDFPPCHGKECEEWSYKKMKNEKYFVHVDESGRFTRRKLS